MKAAPVGKTQWFSCSECKVTSLSCFLVSRTRAHLCENAVMSLDCEDADEVAWLSTLSRAWRHCWVSREYGTFNWEMLGFRLSGGINKGRCSHSVEPTYHLISDQKFFFNYFFCGHRNIKIKHKYIQWVLHDGCQDICTHGLDLIKGKIAHNHMSEEILYKLEEGDNQHL